MKRLSSATTPNTKIPSSIMSYFFNDFCEKLICRKIANNLHINMYLSLIDTRLTKAWTAINRLSIIWKSDLTDKMKRSFIQAAVTSILLYGCTTWTLTKRLEKKLDGNYTRMLHAIWNNTPQDTNYTATCLLSRKLFKLDEPDMQDTAGEARTN